MTVNFRVTNLGSDQLDWLLTGLDDASKSPDIKGIVILMTFPWYSTREWNANSTLVEKEAISQKIVDLRFNMKRKDGSYQFLVAIAGDTHMLAFDTGFHNEDYGEFPIFQCSPIDSPPSCKQGGYSDMIYQNRGQFCHFVISNHKTDPNRSNLFIITK